MPRTSLKSTSIITLLFAANVLADNTTDYLHPSFLFLGFRGSSVVKLRPSALLDTFDRVVTVHKNTHSTLSDF